MMLRIARDTLGAALLLLACVGVLAQPAKPKVPAGVDPGGLAIALITHGVDYTKPAVAAGLARDGEGDMIGADFVDGTQRPFAASNALDDMLVALAPGRVIPIRVGEGKHLVGIELALVFLKQTATRVVVLPRVLRSKTDWAPFVTAAKAWPSMLFIVAADDIRDAPGQRCETAAQLLGDDTPPSALGLENVMVVASLHSRVLPCIDASYAWSKPDAIVAPVSALREAPGHANASPRDAGEAAMLAAGLIPRYAKELKGATSAADAKRILLSKAVKLKGLDAPVLECCDRPAPR